VKIHFSPEFIKSLRDGPDEPGGLMACSPEIYAEMIEANRLALRAAIHARERRATALYLSYLEYRAAFAQSNYSAFMEPARYEHFLAMLDYFPDPP
jgi:hypothetical protein